MYVIGCKDKKSNAGKKTTAIPKISKISLGKNFLGTESKTTRRFDSPSKIIKSYGIREIAKDENFTGYYKRFNNCGHYFWYGGRYRIESLIKIGVGPAFPKDNILAFNFTLEVKYLNDFSKIDSISETSSTVLIFPSLIRLISRAFTLFGT